MDARPIGIDLFSGAGGFSLGFEQAGFDVAAAVEIDPVHAATHRFNFPRAAIIPRSVVGLSGKEIRSLSGLEGRDVYVVFGGAPCQGFSMIGKRALDDPRNLLAREFLRLVVELEAKYFVFENVKGITVGNHRRFLAEIVEEFGENGYDVRLPWRVLNACHYGVPQSRERLFLLGARHGRRLPCYPDPMGGSCPTCQEALGDLPEAEEYEELISSDSFILGSWKACSWYSKELRCETDDAWHYGYRREWNPIELTSSMRSRHSVTSRKRFREAMCGTIEPVSRFFKLSPDGISNTLRAGTDSSRGAFTSPRPIHYGSPRCITVREMARLHGYPDWFRFHRTKWHGARQVGNSVPPPLGRAVASSIMVALPVSPCRPTETVEQGDLSLLGLTMAQAARIFGIGVPIGRRDKD